MDERKYGRRAFLGVTLTGLSSLVWGRSAWRLMSGATGGLESALPAGIVPSGWRIYTVAASMPVFNPKTWRLRVEGLVEEPQTFTYDDLKSLPQATQVSDFHCVTGWTVKNVHWTGVRFQDLLAAAKPKHQATDLTFISAEQPYVDSLTIEQAYLHDVMLAYGMDGKPLSRAHGAPARVVIPEMYGYKGVKWVERIVVERNADYGYWEQRGYDVNAYVGHSNGYGLG